MIIAAEGDWKGEVDYTASNHYFFKTRDNNF